MSEENDVYTSSVLTDVIDKYAIQAISATRQGLHFAETNRDQIVWEIATKIYSQSGYKVRLGLIKDVVDSSIKTISEQLDIEERERIAREAAEMEAQKVARLEAERIAVEAENRRRKLLEESVEILRKLAPELLGDEKKSEIFLKIESVIVEQFSSDLEINLDFHLSNIISDYLDLQELCIGLEEAFDIEISDNELEYELDIQFHNTWLSSSGVEPKVRQFGVNSTVRKLVRLVDEKLR